MRGLPHRGHFLNVGILVSKSQRGLEHFLGFSLGSDATEWSLLLGITLAGAIVGPSPAFCDIRDVNVRKV